MPTDTFSKKIVITDQEGIRRLKADLAEQKRKEELRRLHGEALSRLEKAGRD